MGGAAGRRGKVGAEKLEGRRHAEAA